MNNSLFARNLDALRREGIGGQGVAVPRNAPTVPQPQPDYSHDPARSNLSGAASMPMVMLGFSLSTQGQLALPDNIRRGYLYIQNDSNGDILVAFGGNARRGAAVVIGPGSYYEPRVVPTNSIYLAAAAGTNLTAIVVEGVR